jgi:hypothetical protein
MNPRILVLIVAFATSACGSKGKVGDVSEPAKKDLLEERIDTSATDALWAYAPRDAWLGFVVGSAPYDSMLAAANDIKAILRSVPGGAEVLKEFEREVADFNFTKPAAWKKAGLDPTMGGAIFVSGEGQVVAVAPVVDREAFRKLTNMKSRMEGGVEVDYDEHGDDPRCAMVRGKYVCVSKGVELFSLGQDDGGVLRSRLASLAEDERGHAEFIMEAETMPEDAKRELREVEEIIKPFHGVTAAVRLAHGQMTVRARLLGRPVEPVSRLVGAEKSSPSLMDLGNGASGLMRAKLPLQQLFPAESIPSIPGVPVDIRALYRSLTGEIAGFYVPGALGLVFAVGLNSPVEARKALSILCPMAQQPPMLKSRLVDENHCELVASEQAMRQLDSKLSGPLTSVIEVRDEAMVFSFGADGSKEELAKAIGSAVSRKIVFGDWLGAAWVRVRDPFHGLDDMDVVKKTMSTMEADGRLAIGVARIFLGLLYEVAVAVDVDERGYSAMLHVTTMAADMPFVYAKYRVALSHLGKHELSAFVSAMAAIAQESPSSLVALRSAYAHRAQTDPGVRGIGSVAVKAFEKYIAKSKTSEARQFVRKMYDGARAYYMDPYTMGGKKVAVPKFPEPSAGPTPPLGECCKNGGKCSPKMEYWNKEPWISLQYSVDDPHYYSYEYKVNNNSKTPNFTVTAYGDLDCDGVYSTFSMYGEINSEYSDGPAGTAALYRENELE